IDQRARSRAPRQELRDNRRQGRPPRSLARDDEIYPRRRQAFADQAAASGAAQRGSPTGVVNRAAMDSVYESLRAAFKWETPEYFNFGEMIDLYAQDPSRVALLWEDERGNRARLTFADLRDSSNRIATALSAIGIRR